MTELRTALRDFLKDWQDDVPAAWKAVLAGAAPDFDAVAGHLTLESHERIYPLRRGHGDPRAPAGSHVFRALDGLAPDAVRAVLLGQDPYPRISRATGRSFEQGDLVAWDGRVAESLRRMVQALAQFRAPDPAYVAHDDAWPGVRARVLAGNPVVEAPAALFDRWQAAGVLCLNLGLTLSRFDPARTAASDRVQPAHMAMWKPLVRAILVHLACRPNGELLVILWGDKARQAFEDMDVEQEAESAGSRARLVVVNRVHPAADGPRGNRGASPFLCLDDPFTQANEALERIGAPPIDW